MGQHVAALSVSAAQAAAMKSFGDLPLVVLSGDHHPVIRRRTLIGNATWRSSRRTEYNSWRVAADTGFIWTGLSW